MADMAYDYIASNFQILLKEKKLKERMLSELPAHKLTRILGSRVRNLSRISGCNNHVIYLWRE